MHACGVCVDELEGLCMSLKSHFVLGLKPFKVVLRWLSPFPVFFWCTQDPSGLVGRLFETTSILFQDRIINEKPSPCILSLTVQC